MARVFYPVKKKREVVLLKGNTRARIMPQTLKNSAKYRDLLDAWRYHSWLRASLSVIGRSLVGPGVDIRPVKGYPLSNLKRKRIRDFIFSYGDGNWNSIKDYYTPSAKLYITAVMIKLFGRAAWEITRDEKGRAIGYDVIFGEVKPNVDDDGNFKTPAFTQKLGSVVREFDSPYDIVYFLWPEADGSVLGGSDIEALIELVIPADLYAQGAYRNLHKNQSTPDGIWHTDPNMDNKTYEAIKEQIRARYEGTDNFGRAFITAKGDVDFRPIVQPHDDAPYLEGREMARNETSAVTGVPGAKMGLTREMTRAGVREVQRFFHESTMVPLFRFMEEVLYNQVCIREFNSPGWRVTFNAPDFMTSMERATVAQRYWSTGSLSPNEIRKIFLSLDEIPGGDTYYVPANVSGGIASTMVPPSPNARAGAVDSGVPTADYVGDIDKPVRADKILDELRDWRKVEKRIRKGKRFQKEFECHEVPEEMAENIRSVLKYAETPEEVSDVFNQVIAEVEMLTETVSNSSRWVYE